MATTTTTIDPRQERRLPADIKTTCRCYVAGTTHHCVLPPAHAGDHEAVGDDGIRFAAPRRDGDGVKLFDPIPLDRQRDVRLPPHSVPRTRHARRFAAFSRGERMEDGSIVSRHLAWAARIAREMGADELRVLRERHYS